jgi:hypothetical protein
MNGIEILKGSLNQRLNWLMVYVTSHDCSTDTGLSSFYV